MNDVAHSHSLTSRRIRWGLPFILLVLVFVEMSPLVQADFVDWDDHSTIALNPSFNPPTVKSIAAYWNPAKPYMDLYVPLTYTLWGGLAWMSPRHAPDAAGISMSAVPFHLANIFLHGVGAVMVMFILWELSGSAAGAFFGGAVFAALPVQVETIGWISGGKDVLCGVLGMVAIWQYVRGAKSGKRWNYVIASAVFIAAVLAKPSAVCVPIIVLVIDLMLLRRPVKKIVHGLWPWVLVAVVVSVYGHYVQPARVIRPPIWFRPIIACDAIAFYLGKLFWPVGLCIDYGHSPYWLLHIEDGPVVWAMVVAVPTVIAVGLLILARWWRWPVAAGAIFVAALLPTLGFVPFEFQEYSTPADHYLYVAMLAPAMMVAFLIANRAIAKVAIPVAVVIVGVLAVLSFQQCFVWDNTVTLLNHALEVNPSSLAANTLMGFYYDTEQPPDLARAAPYFEKVLQDHPDSPVGHFHAANLLMKLGRVDDAVHQYREAIKLDPYSSDSYLNYGAALAMRGEDEDALGAFAAAQKLTPNDPRIYQDIGLIWANRGNVQMARTNFERALALDPNRATLREYLRQHPAATSQAVTGMAATRRVEP